MLVKTRTVSMLGGMMLALAASSAAQPMGLRDFRNWMVGCDNTGICRALGFVDRTAPADSLYLILDREAGPAGKMRLFFEDPVAKSIEIFVDGVSVAKLSGGDLVAIDAGSGTGTENPELIARILASAMNGEKLSLEKDAEVSQSISLSGLKAALLFMDEQQGRIGTETALVGKGTRPANAVRASAPVPLLKKQELPKGPEPAENALKAVTDYHRRVSNKDTCPLLEGEGEASILANVALAPARWLVEMACWRAAYQAGTVFYLLSGGKSPRAEAAPFEILDTKAGRIAIKRGESIANAEFDDASEVSSFGKGRGIGDCGVEQNWRWDGKVYRLSHFKIMTECRSIPNENWITLWLSRDK